MLSRAYQGAAPLICIWSLKRSRTAVGGERGGRALSRVIHCRAGVKMGIPRLLASKLATQTVLGSALLVKTSGLHPAILRDQA